MRTNYVLIDCENVQPSIPLELKKLGCKVMAFMGANQTKVSVETAANLQRMGEDAEYIRISGNGPNALDLHIAFYIGQTAQQNPLSYFHIISKDTGFDPLIEYLKSKGILASRSVSVADIPLLKNTVPPTLADKRAAIVARLCSFGAAKPGSVKTLTSTVHSIFHKQISEQEAGALVKSLEKANLIKIEGTRVAYSLPDALPTT